MTTAAQRPGRTASTATFGALNIDRRVLTTHSRTIAISSIATVSVGRHVEHRPRLLLWIAVAVFAVLAVGATQVGVAAAGKVNVVSAICGLFAAGLAIFTMRPDDQTHYLLVSSSDGVMTRFAGPDRAMLEEARRLLTEKINTGDDASAFAINFETGVIENLSVANGHAAAAAANGNGSAHRGAPANVRVGGGDAGGLAHRSPGRAQPQNGAAHAAGEVYVDFSAMLPASSRCIASTRASPTPSIWSSACRNSNC